MAILMFRSDAFSRSRWASSGGFSDRGDPEQRIERERRRGEGERGREMYFCARHRDAHELKQLKHVELDGVLRRQHGNVCLANRHLRGAHVERRPRANFEFGTGEVELCDDRHAQRILKGRAGLVFEDRNVGLGNPRSSAWLAFAMSASVASRLSA